jgi:PAS domain S-box-containing protein
MRERERETQDEGKGAEVPEEEARLEALKLYGVLDTPAEEVFDDLTRLASVVCGTPVALMSLIDGERIWFKSRVGLDVCEIAREQSFCGRTILMAEIMEVEDALEDELFRSSPLVVGAPGIRFYAGVPLTTVDGYRVGTLCVVDWVARRLTEEQRDGLVRLGRQVMSQLEFRMQRVRLEDAAVAVRESHERTEQVIASALDAVVGMDRLGGITSWNPRAEQIFGWRAEEVVGRRLADVLIPEGLREAHTRGLRHAVATGEGAVFGRRMEMTALRRSGEEIPVELTVTKLMVGGRMLFSAFIRDIGQIKASEARLQRAGMLLSAVGRLQSEFISTAQGVETFEALLQLLLEFTGSEYGFVAEVRRDEEGKPYLKTHAITNIAWNDEMREFYEKHRQAGLEFRNLRTLFGAALLAEDTVIANDPANDPRSGGLPPGHPPMHSFLGVPIKQGGEMIAMVGVSNRPGGYNMALVEEIEPLLSTYATIIRGFKLGQQRQLDQRRIEGLNVDLEARAHELAEALQEKGRLEHERLEALREYSASLERRVAERTEELEQSRKQFEEMFEFAPDPLVMADRGGVIQLVNRQAEKLFGWGREELRGQLVDMLLPEVRRKGYLVAARGKSGVAGSREGGPGRRKDGTEFPLEISLGMVQSGEDDVLVISIRDVSEKVRMEERVKLQAEALASTNDMIWVTGRDGLIRYCNEALLETFGYTQEELKGRCPGVLQLPHQEEELMGEMLRRTRDGGTGWQGEVINLKKDGTEFPVFMSMSEVRGLDGQASGMIGVLRDISESRELEQEMAHIISHEQERLSQELHDHLGAYWAGIAFRFKVLAQMLERRSAEEAGYAQQLVLEVNAGVQQVRNFARMLAPVELASGGLAAGLAQLGREMETVFNIVCRVEVAEGVPVPTMDRSLAMYRIAQEAARNAVQHGRAREVVIELMSDEYSVKLRVVNEGRSWDPERVTGAGLGLRIMRHRAASVGGTFVIHATAEGRTEAVCRIPHRPKEKVQRTMISE